MSGGPDSAQSRRPRMSGSRVLSATCRSSVPHCRFLPGRCPTHGSIPLLSFHRFLPPRRLQRHRFPDPVLIPRLRPRLLCGSRSPCQRSSCLRKIPRRKSRRSPGMVRSRTCQITATRISPRPTPRSCRRPAPGRLRERWREDRCLARADAAPRGIQPFFAAFRGSGFPGSHGLEASGAFLQPILRGCPFRENPSLPG